MNNELIERIDHCLKHHHVPPLLSKVLISCKAALTQQQEAEPEVWRESLQELVEALELISDTDPDEGTAWFHEIAYKALEAYRKGGE